MKARKIISIVGNTIIWIFVAFAVLLTVMVFTSQSNNDGLPSIGGKCIITIVSDSMAPTFKTGDLIIGDRLTAEEKANLKENDVITFYTDVDGDGTDEVVTHRIQSFVKDKGYTTYTTKGDNNKIIATEEVVHSNVLAKYTDVKLNGVGTVLEFLQTPTGFLIVIVLPLVLFFLFELYRFILVIVTQKKGKISAADEEMIKQKAIQEFIQSQQNAQGDDDSVADASSDGVSDSAAEEADTTDSSQTESEPNTNGDDKADE